MSTWMLSPKWRKLGRDLLAQRGRLLLLALAVTVSLIIIGTVLGAYAILMREMPLNYALTKPASATLELGADIPRSLVDEVRQRPGIADVEARGFVRARAKVDGQWIRLTLYVIDDFTDLRLNTFEVVSGEKVPPDGAMQIERMAIPLLKVPSSGQLLVKTPHGSATTIVITGVVHDRGQAQAWQEHSGYGYISRRTLGLLGEPAVLDELRIATSKRSHEERVRGHQPPRHFWQRTNAPDQAKKAEQTARELAAWLGTRGIAVHEIHVPPPGKHPHQFQITLVLLIQLAFGVMALLLSGILLACAIDAMLARQVREIGVMKTVGATSRQIAGLYAVTVVSLGAVATLLALPIASMMARKFAGSISERLNFILTSETIPLWVFLVVSAAGMGIPLLIASLPIRRATRVTVREAIDEWGAGAGKASGQSLARFLSASFVSRAWSLALRNALRARAVSC